MKCINCGNELEENAKFCASCGTVVQEIKPVEHESVEQEKTAEQSAQNTNNCKNCGAALEQGAKFCPTCGATTVPQAVICRNCGTKIEPGVKFCPTCGTPSASSAPGAGPVPFAAMPNIGPQPGPKETFEKLNKTPDTTNEYDPEDISMFKRISIVAYLGLLVLIPILCFPKSKFTRYHSNQGLNLAIVELVFYIIMGVLNLLLGRMLFFLILLGIIAFAGSVVVIYLMVVGIVNAAKGRARELPVIGKFRLLK